MKYVAKLTEPEIVTLNDARRNHPRARPRNRAHMIILSDKGYRLKEIADICGVTRQAVSRLIDEWEEAGLAALYDAPRPGRPGTLTPEDEEFVHGMAEKEPRSTNKILAALEEEKEKKISKSTLRRTIEKKRVWKRIRKSLKGKRNEEKFREKQNEIRSLEERREKGEIDVRYFDGAGFNETPCVPYAYQPKGEYIEIAPARGKTLNVVAFMNKDNECMPFVFECTIDSDVVIACFDSFAETIEKETHVVIDNAPVHKSKKFMSRLADWEEKGLKVVFLPEYSPELNLIEILWRKMKYAWLPFSAYSSFQRLTECVEDILINFGSRYVIEFA